MKFPGQGRIAIAFLAGAGTTLSFAPTGWWWLQFVTVGALVHLWRDANPRTSLACGFAFGLGWFGSGISWVYVSMHDHGAMPAPLAGAATLLFAAYLALFPAVTGYAQARLRPATGRLARLLSPLTLPALWCLAEWLRGWLFTGFPWLALGYAHTDGPLAAYAPWFGVRGLDFLAVLGAAQCAALATAVSRRAGAARIALPAGTVALLTVVGLGAGRIDWTQASANPVSIALLQGNIPQDMKFEPGRFESTLMRYRQLIEANPAALVVLPETALPRMLQQVPADYLAGLDALAKSRGANLIVGSPFAEARGRYFNSAVSLGTSPSQRYDKAHLVPFGEFIPFGFRWFTDLMHMPLGDFTRGTDAPVPLRLGTEKVAVNICYEDLFGEEIIRQLPEATLLVNISNIAWFGDSLAPHQHLQISRMRALETGRPMLRATNTGATAVIDARGRVQHLLAPFSEGALTATVRGHAGATPYVRTGNWPVITSCAGLIAAAIALAALRARRAARAPGPA